MGLDIGNCCLLFSGGFVGSFLSLPTTSCVNNERTDMSKLDSSTVPNGLVVWILRTYTYPNVDN